LYAFADYWFLQRLGGSTQQGYYAIGVRFANISLIAATSMMQVFWKEIAEAHAAGNMARVRMLYRMASRVAYTASAAVSCALIPFTREILVMFVGSSYQGAWLPLSLMFLSSLYQSLGQVATTMFYATGKTKTQSYIWIFVMMISLPLTYILLASPSAAVPGLQLGALGLAVKRLAVLIVGVNLAVFFVVRSVRTGFDWKHQVYVILLFLPLGFLSKTIARGVLFPAFFADHIVWVMLLAGFLYATMVMLLFYFLPSILGMNKDQIRHGISWIRVKIRPVQMVWK
jgi:O-antigen/teichoic acid export membrane protein